VAFKSAQPAKCEATVSFESVIISCMKIGGVGGLKVFVQHTNEIHAQFNYTALSRNKKVLSSLANMLPWLVCQFLQHSDLISWTIGYIENYFVVGDLYSPPITNLKMLSLVSIPRCLIFFANLKHPQNPGCYLIIWLRVLCVCHGYETLNGSGLSQHIQHPLQNLEALACFFVAI